VGGWAPMRRARAVLSGSEQGLLSTKTPAWLVLVAVAGGWISEGAPEKTGLTKFPRTGRLRVENGLEPWSWP